MHPALLTAYATMLPRLEAEEDLRRVFAIAAGTGSFKNQHDFRRYMSTLSRAAGDRPQGAQTLADLEALGVEVVKEPKRG